LATWTSRQPGGLSDLQIAGIEAIVAPLAGVAEIWAMRRTAGILLDTYVGPHAGERILAARRIEEIHAAIWRSDMRGFTTWTDSIPPRLLIDLLNRYFDCQVPAILDHGGRSSNSWAMGYWRSFRSPEAMPTRRKLAAARSPLPVRAA
jgi:adenylate cyclase